MNSSNVDMVVSYKRDQWEGGKNGSRGGFGPHDKFEKGEAWNPKCNKTSHGSGERAEFHMPKKDKRDKSDKEC